MLEIYKNNIKLLINLKKKNNLNFVFDSRLVKKGDVFVGIKTNRDDGSIYYQEALAKGCRLAIINQNIINKKILYCPNVQKFLNLLIQSILINYKGKIIAITGSVGKTTLKENIYNILKYNNKITYKSYKNYNNQLGLIINICNMSFKSDYSIFEVGINNKNEMNTLTKILNPHYVLITNIENSHIGNFNDYDDLVKNKLKLLTSNNLISSLANFHYDQKILPITYRKNKNINFINLNNDIFIKSLNKSRNNFLLNFVFNNVEHSSYVESSLDVNLKIAIFSYIFIQNFLNIKIKGMSFYNKSLLFGHGNIIKIIKSNYSYTIYDHSYNASPYSMNLSLKNFMNMNDYSKDNIIVLGSMKELGDMKKKFHNDVLSILNNRSNTYFTGEEFSSIVKKDMRKNIFSNLEDLIKVIKKDIKKAKKIFIMGSRVNNLELIVKNIC